MAKVADPKEWKGRTVLIVDDSPNVRQELRGLFEKIGMQVVGEAANGVEALAKIAEHAPDLVSLDLIMPEMDGVECFRKIQEQFPETRCVIISWVGGEPKVLHALAEVLPSHLCLAKPVDATKLTDHLNKLYGNGFEVKKLAEPEEPPTSLITALDEAG